MRRVVQTLLHAPTVRVKELAEAPGGDQYADALRELFDLDPAAPAAGHAVRQLAAARTVASANQATTTLLRSAPEAAPWPAPRPTVVAPRSASWAAVEMVAIVTRATGRPPRSPRSAAPGCSCRRCGRRCWAAHRRRRPLLQGPADGAGRRAW